MADSRWDTLWIDADLATMVEGPGDSGPRGFGEVRGAALAAKDGRIAWLGPMDELPAEPEALAHRVEDVKGRWITPGLVDCHTHLIFAGDRAAEFEMRLAGASYADIARQGGGIRSTVAATRKAGTEELLAGARARLEALMAEGVTTVEIKSGYGLDVETELRMLEVARTLGRTSAADVRATLLGAHALPEEYEGRRSEYVELVVREMLPRAAEEGLADAVDAFCEDIAFTPAECREVLEAARGLGLKLRLHADQLSDQGGAGLAAELGARSADHLEHASEAGVRAMAEAGTAAVLLPGAFLFLGEERKPPVAVMRKEGVPMAVATDLNPGSSPLLSPLLAMNLACVLFGLTPAEALAGMTRVAAGVLGLDGDRGTLAVGQRADLAVWSVRDPSELAYWMGADPLESLVKDGEPVVAG